jgi:aspartate dehydrogenase
MRVGIAGFGTIGSIVGRALDQGLDGMSLEAVAGRDRARTLAAVSRLGRPVDVVAAGVLAQRCDVIVECAPSEAFESLARPALEAGRTLLTVSAAALLRHPELIELAKSSGARIILATGALLGLDAVRAAAEGSIQSVTMITRKPPKSLQGAPYLLANHIDIEHLSAPLKLFAGSAREGAVGFPANVNVAAALALAGIGPERTRLEIWADPSLSRNIHTIKVEADSARFEMTIENVPSADKPGTGRITALSVIAALRALTATLRVGS